MTSAQNQHAPSGAVLVLTAALDAVDAAGPQVYDDMTVEVALSVMVSARTRHLAVCDNDALRIGLVTRAELTAVRDDPRYSDRLQLRDVLGRRGPYATPAVPAEDSGRRTLAVRSAPVERDGGRGALARAL
ncbi:CBS domain-containing protein [Streptomyces californicus]|uniref:CBS domain-containing protein n=1 Tax=Streptomyces TaxID=1883 RepID=UPI000BF01ADD